MKKAHPSANYCWGGVFGYQMGVSATGTVPASAARKMFVQAELLRCKQVLDLALDGQQAVINADWGAAEDDSEGEGDPPSCS